MDLNDAVIEITRKCNMVCDHCLRGDAQNCNIKHEYIDQLFSKVDYISSLSITGGEPTLNVDAIDYIVESAQRHNVDIGNFYIVTNGESIPDAFLMALIKLHCYCSDNEISGVKVSGDDFHDEATEKDKLSAFSFVEFEKDKSSQYLVNEGYAYDNGLGSTERNIEEFYVDDDTVDGTVYLNCKGNIIAGCDWSYDSQDEQDKIVCFVNEFSLEKVKEFSKELTLD